MYYSNTEQELAQVDIREGELAICTGAQNFPEPDSVTPNISKRNAYVYLYYDGAPHKLSVEFQRDDTGLDVLKALCDYVFLCDRDSGYIRQVSGPARPVTVCNLGSIPLRVDTFLGKFIVYSGTILRLDSSAPRREKKKVLITVGSRQGHTLKSAEIWDGSFWRRLNLREELSFFDTEGRLGVFDGNVPVQCMTVNERGEIFMLDSPEPDPDYEIYMTGKMWDKVTLRFPLADYRNGQVGLRTRELSFSRWGAQAIYDLQKVRDSRTQGEVYGCVTELPERPAREAAEAVRRGLSEPGEASGPASGIDWHATVQRTPDRPAKVRRRGTDKDKLREFLDS